MHEAGQGAGLTGDRREEIRIVVEWEDMAEQEEQFCAERGDGEGLRR